jgi:deoxyribodipyrimidine photo-lyase
VANARPLICVYVLDDETPERWRLGGAARWWLEGSLDALSKALAKRGGSLILRSGHADGAIKQLVAETGAGAVFWNRCYEPYAVKRDTKLKQDLSEAGVKVETSNGALLFEPWTLRTKSGDPYKVFTPFWRACSSLPVRAPLPVPTALRAYAPAPQSDALSAWRLRPTNPNWAAGLEARWRPGEVHAANALAAFIDD